MQCIKYILFFINAVLVKNDFITGKCTVEKWVNVYLQAEKINEKNKCYIIR